MDLKDHEWYKRPYEILPRVQINYKGTCDFKEYYKMLHDWLTSRDFLSVQSRSVNIEDYYMETVIPGSGAKNHWIWWRTMKEENDMFHYYIDVEFQTLVLMPKEVIVNGLKLKFHEGEMNMWITAKLFVDPSKKWSDSSLLKRAAPIVKQKTFIEMVDDKEGDLQKDAVEFFERAKQYLQLMNSKPMLQPFHPVLGHPQVQPNN